MELSGLRKVKTYKYLTDAELADAQVSSAVSRDEAQVAPAVGRSEHSEITKVADRDDAQPPELGPSLEHPAGIETPDIPIENMGEADLVENLTFHRGMYNRLLTALTAHYSEQGPPEKAAWARPS